MFLTFNSLGFNCARRNEETASNVLFWEPQHGHPNRGRPRTTYIDTIKADIRTGRYKRNKRCHARSGRVERFLLGRLGIIPGLSNEASASIETVLNYL